MLREALINLLILTAMLIVVLMAVERLTGVKISLLLLETVPGRLAIAILLAIFVWFRGSLGSAE